MRGSESSTAKRALSVRITTRSSQRIPARGRGGNRRTTHVGGRIASWTPSAATDQADRLTLLLNGQLGSRPPHACLRDLARDDPPRLQPLLEELRQVRAAVLG